MLVKSEVGLINDYQKFKYEYQVNLSLLFSSRWLLNFILKVEELAKGKQLLE